MDASVIKYNKEKFIAPPNLIDEIESRLLELGGAVNTAQEGSEDFPIVHRFTPGLYIRELFLPAGGFNVSKIHKTEHPYVISKGYVMVMTEDGKWQEIKAPYTGITKPGRRRFVVSLEDTVWTTFHVTDKTDVNEIEKDLIENQSFRLEENV